jgi:hypothetical protein
MDELKPHDKVLDLVDQALIKDWLCSFDPQVAIVGRLILLLHPFKQWVI